MGYEVILGEMHSKRARVIFFYYNLSVLGRVWGLDWTGYINKGGLGLCCIVGLWAVLLFVLFGLKGYRIRL